MAKWKYSNKESAFVEHYLRTWNGTLSMREAGYRGNDNNLAAMASEYLRKPKIRTLIDRRLREITMSADEVLKRLHDMATCSIADFYDESGSLDWEKIKTRGHLIKELTYLPGAKISIKLYSAKDALALLGKYYSLFTDRVKIDDWRSEIIALIRDGRINSDDVEEEFGADIATELFESAGIRVSKN